MQTAKPSPTLLYHLNPKASHHWERATAVHYVDACGRTHTDGKSIQLQTPLAPLEKFSRKDYIHLTHYACNSIPNTENRAFACQESLRPGELQQSMVRTKSLWARQEGSCHQTSAKRSSGLASYHATSSQIQPLSGTVPKCLKKSLSSPPEAEHP